MSISKVLTFGLGGYLLDKATPKPPELQPLPSIPTEDDAKAATAEENLKKRSQYTNTILTDPQGLLGQPNTENKTLLGE